MLESSTRACSSALRVSQAAKEPAVYSRATEHIATRCCRLKQVLTKRQKDEEGNLGGVLCLQGQQRQRAEHKDTIPQTLEHLRLCSVEPHQQERQQAEAFDGYAEGE